MQVPANMLDSIFKNKNRMKKAKNNVFFFLWDVVVLSWPTIYRYFLNTGSPSLEII